MKTYCNVSKAMIAGLLLISITACSTKANFVAENSHGPATLELEGKTPTQLPASHDIMSTTFGQYTYTISDEKTKVNGLLPLKVRPARIVLDILFFAPALFFNIQSACDTYTVDMETGIIICEDNGKKIPVKATATTLE